MTRLALVLFFASAACSPSALLGVGEECRTSSECAEGLLCDRGVSPPVCSPASTRNDLSAAVDDMAMAPPDLTGVDLTGADLTAPPADMTMAPADMTQID